MRFDAPQFLVLLPLLALAGWQFRRLALWQPLRALALLLLVLALADPQVRRLAEGMDLWVLVDRSASAEAITSRDAGEWRRLLESSRPSASDRVFPVDYAAEVVSRPNQETAGYPGDRSLTRTALAINEALALADRGRHARILVFTDGHSTEPLAGLAEKLAESGVPLDYRLLAGDEGADYRVAGLALPSRGQVGEPFLIDIAVAGRPDGEVPLALARNGRQIAEATVTVTGGRGALRFTDRVAEPGSHRYEAVISPPADAHPGNNRREAWVEIAAGPRVLLATRYQDDPVAAILRAQGFAVQTVEDPASLGIGMLSGTKCVILNNVPAHEVPGEFLRALDFFVAEQGGGLMMAGGRHSFGSGGYHDSAIDPLLPVTMELKSEHRKLAVAMAIVMDRSGSMSMTTSSGHSKMQLANEGAGRAVELLGSQDLVAVHAVDTRPHQIVPLLRVGDHRAEIISRVRRIESMGGGIYVYTGLKAAWEELKQAEVGQRHIILFTDAADSEEPGDYRRLLEEMTANGGTVSVIGLGTRADPDAAFIEDVARRGQGRIFFTDVPGELPNIFAQETVTVARSSFLEEPTGAQPTGAWHEISPREFEWLAEVDGYNLSYTREGDAAALVSADEYLAPLVAWGRRGAGRTAAVSFPLGGEFSERVRAWPRAGDFLQTMARWLMGELAPPGIGLRHELAGTTLSVELLHDEGEWSERFALRPPRLALSRGAGGGPAEELVWERVAPGRYAARAELREGELVRGVVQAGDATLPFGPLAVGVSAEWAFDPERVAELRSVAEISGGRELVDLREAWRKPERKAHASVRPWLLVLLLLCVVGDALATRTGWRLPRMQAPLQALLRTLRRPRPAPAPPARAYPAPDPSTPPAEEPAPPTAIPPGAPGEKSAADAARERQSRFDRAKKGR